MIKKTRHLHVLGWLVYASYQLLGVFLQRKPPLRVFLWLSLSFLVVQFIEFYLCYLVVYPRFLRTGRPLKLVAALAGIVALFIGLRYRLEQVLYPVVLGFHNYSNTAFGEYLFDNIYYASPAIVISGALYAGQAARRTEQENQQLRDEKRVAEVAFLKTQINPHFLYNTLNLLYSMAYPVAKPLAAAILKLAELMRYMLHDSGSGQVDLAQEIDYLNNYLALYRLRFPDQLFVDFTVTGEPAGHRLAPLLLIPFVENAMKHGVLDDPAEPVRIRLALQPDELLFEVENRRSDYQKDATTGIGLDNLRRRLELLYPGRYSLRIAAAGLQFTTSLRLAQ
ncbi:histidine kinase [Hymenobacter sp. BT664]|uniref:Histidine kinase n=1 Tax=Hymenobacter montanus TaxID=2771359 RepID=A0A927GK41_9BACT|nr:histidine kinase [Hymenobacter montanus]MBD2769152.1 histidine kinase [Hymenobacter montanus]